MGAWDPRKIQTWPGTLEHHCSKGDVRRGQLCVWAGSLLQAAGPEAISGRERGPGGLVAWQGSAVVRVPPLLLSSCSGSPASSSVSGNGVTGAVLTQGFR